MAFDKETRNALAKAVTACRRLLMADVTDQLRGTFGMHPDGTVLPLKDLRHLTDDQRDAAQALRDLLDHYAAAAAGTADEKRRSAYERMVLEIAFTNLNRLAALRMCEERGLVLECVRKGPASDGFRMYEQLSGGALGTRFETYRLFLASLYDELAIDLGILFDRTTPQSAVFPTERCLEEVLAELNKAELAQLWKEDETIGWVYQYFNPPEERREMRDASQAPRNSRELAVRNQFFTPRYVVEFLTDNTLGRIWYEMRQGVTGLKEQCRYLVRRPDEVFLGHMTVPGPDGSGDEGTIAAANLLLEGTEGTFADFDASRHGDVQRMICMSHTVNGYARHEAGTWDGQEPLAAKMRAGELKDLSTQDILDYLFLTCRADRHGGMGEVYSERWFVAACNEVRQHVLTSRNEDLPQEELLKQPVFVPYRAKKDPRDLKILDPACGSGHFLLYCFDLLLLIYIEAWKDGECPKSEATGKTLREDYATLDELCRAAPELILRWNLHGIDIDPRAVQIAALALWLRAQRAWQEQHVKAANRPQVTKSNIVIAEPMPGEEDMRREFIEALRPRVLGQLVDALFDKMKLAGEAGSLLRIEEEIRDAVADAKTQWLQSPQSEQQFLFPELKKPQQLDLRFDLAGVTDAAFWDHAEEQITDALRVYAERVRHGDGLRKQLFAEDAARGFAFLDLCRQQYDVCLMNPPFGEASKPSASYVDGRYTHSSGDVFQAFVESMIALAHETGRVGVLSARTGFFLGNSEDWRRHVVFNNRLACFVDLGLGVLDAALVEVAAYVIEKAGTQSSEVFINRQLATRDKEPGVLESVSSLSTHLTAGTFLIGQNIISRVPGCVFAYWAPPRLLRRYVSGKSFRERVAQVRQGIATADDFRFARLGWEVAARTIGKGNRWIRFSKGGEYSPFYDDVHLLLDWMNNGKQLKAFPGCFVRNEGFYFRPGATYTVRTASAFAGKVLPQDCIFSHNAQSWFVDSNDDCLSSIGYLSSRVPQAFLELAVGAGDIATAGSAARRYTTAVVESVPSDPLHALKLKGNDKVLRHLLEYRLREFSRIEASCLFQELGCATRCNSLLESARAAAATMLDDADCALGQSRVVDEAVVQAFALTEDEKDFVDNEIGPHPSSYTKCPDEAEVERLFSLSIEELMNVAVASQGSKRWFTKKSYFVDRRLEIVSHLLEASPTEIVDVIKRRKLGAAPRYFVESMLSEGLGMVLGRWDIRLALDRSLLPPAADSFEPLPVCPPAMLVGPDGLPASSGDIVSEEWLRARPNANTLPRKGSVNKVTIRDEDYPLRVSWSGILAEDPGLGGAQQHRDDIIHRVRQVMTLLWADKAQAIEQEACEILGVVELRDYFAKPTGFFSEHLQRYSKSRRNAPIYWPLSTASGSYSIWIYYHRLTDQTLYTAVNKYLEPKIDDTKRAIGRIEQEQGKGGGREGARLRDQVNEARVLLGELEEMREELLRISGLPYKPNLNDGVLINAAPLHSLFRHRQWAKDTADVWKGLEKGEYDWAHMAYTIWPERVKKVCKKDLSIAIAHGLEDLYEGPKPGEKKERKPRGKKAKKEAAE